MPMPKSISSMETCYASGIGGSESIPNARYELSLIQLVLEVLSENPQYKKIIASNGLIATSDCTSIYMVCHNSASFGLMEHVLYASVKDQVPQLRHNQSSKVELALMVNL